LNCQKNGKSCPGPPANYTFKNSEPRVSISAVSVTADEHPKIIGKSALLQHHKLLTVGSDQYWKHLTQLHERDAGNGSVLHKFRISHKTTPLQKRSPRRASTNSLSPPKSPFLRQPSPSHHHELARALIAATTTGNSGVCMSVFGPFIREVPSRLGHSPALDAATAVLVNAHTSLVQKKTALEIVSPQLYLRAIKNLQICLDDPHQGRSSNTLCASVLLSLVEVSAAIAPCNGTD
jgi:hypothetical protein